MNLTKTVNLPDMPSTDDLIELADHAADAISSVAGHVPGLDDYRAVARRRRWFSIVGVVAVALVVAMIIRRRRDDSSTRAD